MESLLIPAHKTVALDKKIARINKKAIKLGFNPINHTYGETIYQKVPWTIRHDVGCFEETKITVAFKPVTIDMTEIIKVNGYRIIGMLERHDHKTNIVNLVCDDHGLDIVALRNKSEYYCEHCRTHRVKKYLGIVQKMDTGEIKYVGKSCLAEYIGIDITTIINMMDYTYFTNAVCPDDDYIDYSDFPKYHSFQTIVGYSFNAMVLNNFVYDDQTKSDVYEAYADRVPYKHKITPEMGEAFRNYCLDMEQSYNGFESNLYLSASAEYVHDKCFNIVMGGFCSWLKKQKKIERVAKENLDNNFFGTVGQRETFELVPTAVHTYSGNYGIGIIVKGVQKDTGNKFTWFTNESARNEFIRWEDNGDYNVVADTFIVAATVKDHKVDAKFGNSTILSRISFKA